VETTRRRTSMPCDDRASIDIGGLVVNRICGDACGRTASSETGEIREISGCQRSAGFRDRSAGVIQ
jgi:hypothetical protein